jgi:hypothetical protein
MYTIIHVKKGWIVCDGQTKLIKFNRKSVALRTAHSAEKLLRTNEAAGKKGKTDFRGQGSYCLMIRCDQLNLRSQARPRVAS